MKKLLTLAVNITLFSCLLAQENITLRLKNGSSISGRVIEKTPNEQITIKLSNDSVLVYRYNEIFEVVNEDVMLDEYGGAFSYGVAIGGGGIVGMPIRGYLTQKFAIEVGVFYRISNPGNIVFAGGPVLYFSKKYYPKKEKITSHGISLKGGKTFSNHSETLTSFSWVYERFKKKNKYFSFVFELGGGAFFAESSSSVRYFTGNRVLPMIYWKFHWSWYN